MKNVPLPPAGYAAPTVNTSPSAVAAWSTNPWLVPPMRIGPSAQVFEHASVSMLLPSSHASPGSSTPLRQTAQRTDTLFTAAPEMVPEPFETVHVCAGVGGARTVTL